MFTNQLISIREPVYDSIKVYAMINFFNSASLIFPHWLYLERVLV